MTEMTGDRSSSCGSLDTVETSSHELEKQAERVILSRRDQGAPVHGKGTSHLNRNSDDEYDPLSARFVDTGH